MPASKSFCRTAALDHVPWLFALQEQQLACMDACGSEYLGKVPKLKADMSEDMKRLDQGY